MEQGQHQHYISSVESYLGFVSIDKTTFPTAGPSVRSAAYMEDRFPHRVYFLLPCFRTCPTITDRRLDTGDSPSRPIIHIRTQVLNKGLNCVLSCTIAALHCHLSNGKAEDRLLCQVRANLKIVGFAIYSLKKRHLQKIRFTDIRLILLRWVTFL